jgi:hypothetical protein
MKNSLFLKKNINSNPYILKSILSMIDVDDIDHRIIKHLCFLIHSHKNILKQHKLAYNNYKKVKTLYNTLLFITNKEPISLDFLTLPQSKQIKILNENLIQWEFNKKQNIVVHSENYETTRLIGSSKWCICFDESTWDYYNKGKKHIIIIKELDIIGVSYNNNTFSAYNLKNENVRLSNVRKDIPNLSTKKMISGWLSENIESIMLYTIPMIYTFIIICVFMNL